MIAPYQVLQHHYTSGGGSSPGFRRTDEKCTCLEFLKKLGEPNLQNLNGAELKKLKPHIEAVGGKVIYFPRLLLIYLAPQVDKSVGRITVALLKRLDRDYLPDDFTELKFPVRIYD